MFSFMKPVAYHLGFKHRFCFYHRITILFEVFCVMSVPYIVLILLLSSTEVQQTMRGTRPMQVGNLEHISAQEKQKLCNILNIYSM